MCRRDVLILTSIKVHTLLTSVVVEQKRVLDLLILGMPTSGTRGTAPVKGGITSRKNSRVLTDGKDMRHRASDVLWFTG